MQPVSLFSRPEVVAQRSSQIGQIKKGADIRHTAIERIRALHLSWLTAIGSYELEETRLRALKRLLRDLVLTAEKCESSNLNIAAYAVTIFSSPRFYAELAL